MNIEQTRTMQATDWYKDAVIYQLHVKSFHDANGDGIGDFPGLIEKLDYIADLGVDTLWLLPFYPSPRRDDGYDIGEYKAVHPDYGTMDDFRRFVDAAHARGIRVITELVINHTSDQHEWFQRARHAPPGSPERDFYVWSDTDTAYAGTRIIFCDTEKSNWTFDPVAGQYFWHRFYSHQPDLNFDNPAVLEAVLDVMRFWLDMGVDGLRLDAVPYLIEREGTSNENLEETHGILRQIRAALDAEYPDRMLLAEANMWPEDTRAYFGDGDECHMAFHFPLMPRMYMAIAREDRFPISDILRQTPEIPEPCQWALFLRNHDELTLEMVTDEERDYLWQTYAADRRARINLGIRRRLAPLLERDRRRIELMTSLLLTMPGTPVIYYGDEIGMGDNIHLGDRDGVRTPMQWSIDRNGGFSRGDPASMVLPPIMDPVFGYQAVNVEAQQRDAHSLLNWTRRMLAVRSRHRVFGRGSFRFLYPGNRKVLAYLRELDGDIVLCVANLSRTLQAVELDLCEFEGAVPVDLLGGVAFPPVGRLTYLLTLPPYGFYAFQLVANGRLPDWHVPLPEPMPDYRTLVLRGETSIEALLRDHRQAIEEVLPPYLEKRRWYAAKERTPSWARLGATFPLPDGGGALVEIVVDDGGDGARYLLPLAIVWPDGPMPVLAEQLTLARVRRGPRVGYLTDAFAVESFVRAMAASLRDGAAVPGEGGASLEFRPLPQLSHVELADDAQVRWLGVEQSNSSLVLGEHAVLKLFRHPAGGINPEIEIGRHLAQQGYGGTPCLLGEIVHATPQGETSWGVLTEFVRNLGDGWSFTRDQLRRVLFEADTAGQGMSAAPVALADYEQFARRLGIRLAELHEILARPGSGPDFAPEPVDPQRARGWREAIAAELRDTLALLEGHRDREAVGRLLQHADELKAIVELPDDAFAGSLATRVHGDFHLGQVLVLPDDAYIIDFEGEPARSLDQRRAKASPLRDVAGLLRSLDYAAEMALHEEGGPGSVMADHGEGFLVRFRERAGAAFLDGYRSVLSAAEAPWLPERIEALLAFFLVEKAAYEIRYEASHRPHLIEIPVRGLLRLLGREPA
jgi:maltose alpha-D-glucosyltransferase/alpha-amylase